ncbi:hypothetical protein M3670_09225 [Cytobacillus kochii]|nr:hypothetical protein [Cytobacillus kochii]MCM3322363.1 hypothetical protein [Cytobacillus kochii]
MSSEKGEIATKKRVPQEMSSEKGRTATKRRAPPEINKVKRSVPQV